MLMAPSQVSGDKGKLRAGCFGLIWAFVHIKTRGLLRDVRELAAVARNDQTRLHYNRSFLPKLATWLWRLRAASLPCACTRTAKPLACMWAIQSLQQPQLGSFQT